MFRLINALEGRGAEEAVTATSDVFTISGINKVESKTTTVGTLSLSWEGAGLTFVDGLGVAVNTIGTDEGRRGVTGGVLESLAVGIGHADVTSSAANVPGHLTGAHGLLGHAGVIPTADGKVNGALVGVHALGNVHNTTLVSALLHRAVRTRALHKVGNAAAIRADVLGRATGAGTAGGGVWAHAVVTAVSGVARTHFQVTNAEEFGA